METSECMVLRVADFSWQGDTALRPTWRRDHLQINREKLFSTGGFPTIDERKGGQRRLRWYQGNKLMFDWEGRIRGSLVERT